MPENKYELEEVSAITVRVFRIPSSSGLPGAWSGTFEARVDDIHEERPVAILPASTMSGLARLVAQTLEERFDRGREDELAQLGRDFIEADSRRAEAEKELTRMREKFGVLPDEPVEGEAR